MKKLTQKAALALAAAKFGRKTVVQDHVRRGGQSSQEKRDVARLALTEHRTTKPTFKALDLWPADASVGEYRTALAEFHAQLKAWRVREDRLMSAAHYFRFSILDDRGFAYHVVGSGDSWEDALRKAGVEVPE